MAIGTTRRAGLPVLGAPREMPAAAAELSADATRVVLVTLGCDKNTVDSERLLARLAGAGVRVVGDASSADIVVINTCGFIDVAKEESVDAILDAVRLKQDGRIRAVVAMGCMVQRYKTELEAELPEVDLFLGLTEADRLVPELRARGLLSEQSVPTMEQPLRLLSTSTPHTSHLKISEGCDHTCAFCAIPLMRGKHRSTPIEALVREAQQLEAGGVVELNLISQDTTWYGRDILRGTAGTGGEWFVGRTFAGMAGFTAGARITDLDTATAAIGRAADPAGGRTRDAAAGVATATGSFPVTVAGAARRHGLLPELLDALLAGTTIPWLRLFYMYPSGIYPALVEQIAREPRIVPYIDMPIQHGSDSVLKRMRRPERQATIRERVSWLREAIPDVALRTTVIVGFPGETDDEFEDMLTLLEEIRFDHLGAFSYSEEESTPAAVMPDQVDAAVKRERLERVLELQAAIAQERNERWIGREVVVLIDAVTGRDMDDPDAVTGERGAVGRTAWQALEIDGVVYIDDATGAKPGDFVKVRIVDVIETDLKAVAVDN
ncbi:MAG: MiaB/RimO family radical SAM methylthiotransferase [Gemmatimonadetes bacterium]|nr:MiaB/RimO family radical SAM methylthiotransferase [Gemmatimonadota bacterium]